MTATLWDPLADGIPASVWQPGGFQNQGGGDTPSGECNLSAQTDINYDFLDGPIFLDNFDQPDDTELVGTAPTYGALGDWEATADASPVMLAGSIVAPAASGNYSATTEYSPPGSGNVQFNANVASYSELDYTATIVFTASSDAAEAASVTIFIINEDGDASIHADFTRGELTHFGQFMNFDYCGWQNIGVRISEANEFSVLVDGIVVDYTPDTGINWPFGLDPGDITVTLTNAAANGIRVAAVYVNSPA